MPHDHDFQHFMLFILKVVLLQDGKAFARAHMNLARLRLDFT